MISDIQLQSIKQIPNDDTIKNDTTKDNTIGNDTIKDDTLYDSINNTYRNITPQINLNTEADSKINIDAYLYYELKIVPYAFSVKKTVYAVQFHPEIDEHLLCQVKYNHPSLENNLQFVMDNKDHIHEATIKFFTKWIDMYLY